MPLQILGGLSEEALARTDSGARAEQKVALLGLRTDRYLPGIIGDL